VWGRGILASNATLKKRKKKDFSVNNKSIDNNECT